MESTGSVVEPYKKYPALLEVLLNFLKTEQSPGIRREVIFVLLSDCLAKHEIIILIKKCIFFPS